MGGSSPPLLKCMTWAPFPVRQEEPPTHVAHRAVNTGSGRRRSGENKPTAPTGSCVVEPQTPGRVKEATSEKQTLYDPLIWSSKLTCGVRTTLGQTVAGGGSGGFRGAGSVMCE